MVFYKTLFPSDCESEKGTYDDKGQIGYPQPAKDKLYCCKLCSEVSNMEIDKDVMFYFIFV